MQLFEMHLTVSEEEMRMMQRDLDEVKTIVGSSSALATCFQNMLDKAEKINASPPDISNAGAREIALALARAALPKKTGGCS